MRIHLPAFPHTELTRDYEWCAYTSKCRRFAGMMTGRGHAVYTYGTRSDAHATEHITVVGDDDRARWFPDYDPATMVWDGFDDVHAEHWAVMNARTITAIRERYQPGDVIGIIAGRCQQPIADAFPDAVVVEWGIGYGGVFAPFRVFESYAWMHHMAARRPTDDVRLFDTVIPNAFDPADLPAGDGDGGYLLYLGRMTPRKGLPIVAEVATRVDMPVITAGQGPERVPGCEHVGVVRGDDKADLIGGAVALLAPTMYLEPFGGVAVEAMMCGTPAITTDYGAFTETVQPGAGFRCSTLAEFVSAVRSAPSLDRRAVSDYAVGRYSTDVVAHAYDAYLARLGTLGGDGWYTI